MTGERKTWISAADRVIQEEERFQMPDEFKKLQGDGAAEISVALSYSDKDYGNGFEARVSVTLRGSQDAKSLDKLNQLALDRAATFLSEAKGVAEALYDELRSQSQHRNS